MGIRLEKMNLQTFFKISIRSITRSSVRYKSFSKKLSKDQQTLKTTTRMPVETDPRRLVEYVCGSNLFAETGEDIKLKPDSEYPEWLWKIRSPPPLNQLDPNTKTYWNRIRRHRQKEESHIKSLQRNTSVHK